jgi:protein arginine kinase activator
MENLNMLCQNCKENAATIHLTEIDHGQRTETHLCQQCAQKQGLAVQAQMPLNELLSNLLAAAKSVPDAQGKAVNFSGPDVPCPACGMTLRQFSETSLLGCPQDYQHFGKELLPLIERSHAGHSQHCGKTPSRTDPQQKNEVELLRLRQQLEQAVKSEDYETAARLRDQIRQIQE